MSDQSQKVDEQQEKNRRVPQQTPATSQISPEPVVAPELPTLPGQTNIQAQANGLTNARIPTLQRQMMAGRISATHGNLHMQRVRTAMQRHRPTPSPETTSTPEPETDVDNGLGSGGPPTVTPAAPPPAPSNGSGPVVQAKLTVNEPDDQYEQEADEIAGVVLRMPDSAAPPPEEEEGLAVQTAPHPSLQTSSDEPGELSPDVENQITSMQGGGAPLPDEERTFFESRMGADFSDVRIHTGDTAGQTADSINARAYTVGSDIAFNQGEYQPGADAGRELLAHELTHVVQQGGAEQVQRKAASTVQRQDESEDDLPTEEEKAAALAAAEAAEGEAASAKAEGESKANEAQAEAESKKSEGEGAKQEAEAAKAEGPVSAGAEQGQQAAGDGAQAAPSEQAGEAQAAAMQAAEAAISNAMSAAESGAAGGEMAGGGANGAGPSGAGLEGATAAAQAVFEEAMSAAENAEDKAPESPDEDDAYQSVDSAVKGVGQQAQAHDPAESKSGEAQAAAESPQSELEGKAQSKQVGELEQTETPAFDAAAFKAQLMQRIADLAPQTAEEADEFKEDGKMDGVKGEMQGKVGEEKEASQGPLKEKAAEAPDTGSVEPKPVTPLEANDPGALPSEVGAAGATPKPKGAGEFETPLQESSQSIDQQMADAEITDEQLANSNEPEFQAALDAKGEAKTAAQQAPQEYRQFEQEQLSQAQAEAVGAAQEQTQAMQGERTDLLGQVDQEQAETKSEDEQARDKVAQDINAIYEETKTKVETMLAELDGKVTAAFDEGAENAKKAFEDEVDRKVEAYKERRYGGMFGWAKWLKDKVLGMPSEINSIYAQARQNYLTAMDKVIDQVVAIVGTGLAEAKAEVANGKLRIKEYVEQLPQDLQQVGQQAAQNIQGKFDQLEQSIDDKQNELIDTLANKYQENLQAIDARIEEMKEANKGLIEKALDFIGDVIGVIIKLKNMLMEVLSSIADVVMGILKDPIGFIGNLISAVKQGLDNFISRIGEHLQAGFVEWLTGTMGEAGIQMPEDIFSLEGILDLVLQILGLTWENFRARAVGIFGETVVSALETGFELFVILKDEGLVGVWEWVQEQLSNLQDQVIEGIKEMLITEVIEAGIKWIVGLLGGPAGAFVKAAMAIYDIIMWFINNGERLLSLVQSIIDSVAAIASGSLSAAAQYIEDSLAKFIPTAIGFLASLAGVGDLSQKVRKVIDRIQEPVNSAIDYVLNMIKDFVMKIAKMLGFGDGGGEGDGEIGEEMTFSTEEESHKQWVKVEGSQATLMVASEEMSVMERLSSWEARLGSLPPTLKDEAQQLLGQAMETLDNAEQDADHLADMKVSVKTMDDADQISAEQSSLVQAQNALVQTLKRLFEIFDDEEQTDLSSIATYRPKFRQSTKEKFAELYPEVHIGGTTNIKPGYNRAHGTGYEVIRSEIYAKVDGKPFAESAGVLAGEGYEPAYPLTNESIIEAVKKYLRDMHDDIDNLAPGGESENKSAGGTIPHINDRMQEALETGDQDAYLDSLLEYQEASSDEAVENKKHQPVMESLIDARLTQFLDQRQAEEEEEET